MTESHLRRLAATMRALEEGLDEVAGALEESTKGVMIKFEDDIPVQLRPEMLKVIAKLSTEIRKVKDRYELPAQVVSNRRRFVAKLSSLSIDLIEATSKYMRAYGEVPREERQPLDDQIGTMIGLVEELSGSLTQGHES